MKLLNNAIRPLLAGLLLLLLAACAGNGQLDNSALPGQGQGPAPLPAVSSEPEVLDAAAPLQLPSPDESLTLLRSGSFTLADGYADGKDFVDGLPHQRLSAAGNGAVFAPSWPPEGASADKLAYGIYSFTLPDYFDTPVAIHFSWSDAPAEGLAYVGLANFSKERWGWKTLPASDTLNYAGFASFINPADVCLLCVVVVGTDAVVLDSIQLSTPQPPSASIVPDADSGIAPLTVSFDGSGSSDPDGTITNYEWDLDGDGLFNETGAELDAQGTDTAQFSYADPGSYNPVLRVTDNDASQAEATVEINVAASQPPVADLQADFTSGDKPLSVTFNATASMDPDGSITDYEWDFDGDGSYGEAGEEAAAQGDPTPVAYLYGSVGEYDAKVRVTDNDGGKDSATLTISVSNTPPLADLQSDLSEGDAPFAVTFDASGSSDPGGTITDYEWDFDGDGIFNEMGTDEETAHGNPTPAAYTYTDPGPYTATLRVTDDDNATASDSLTITAHGWVIVTAGGPLNGWMDFALINGNPAVAFVKTGGTLSYARSGTALGMNAADWVQCDLPNPSLGGPGRDIALAEVSGGAAVAYTDSPGTEDLYYQYGSGDATSTADWTDPITVDAGGSSTGYNPEMLMVGGQPGIFYDRDSDLYYVRASTASGSLAADWSGTKVLIDNTGNGCDAAIVNGNPAVAYYRYDGANTHLSYCRSSTASGGAAANWAGKLDISLNGPVTPELHIVNGNPAISFTDQGGTLHYLRATDVNGGAWSAIVTLDSGASIYGWYASFAVVAGMPAIAAFDFTNQDCEYFASSTVNGTNAGDWSFHETVDGVTTSSGWNGRILEVDGRPAIGYRNISAQVVKYAIRY